MWNYYNFKFLETYFCFCTLKLKEMNIMKKFSEHKVMPPAPTIINVVYIGTYPASKKGNKLYEEQVKLKATKENFTPYIYPHLGC